MLRRTSVDGGQEVEFVVETSTPVSVVGDFNEWDPHRGVLTATAEGGTHVWRTFLAPGRYAFRYLRDGQFFDDADADAFEPNGYGGFHGVLIVDAAPAAAPASDATDATVGTAPSAGAEAPAKPPVKPRARAAKKAPAEKAAPGSPAAKPARSPKAEPTARPRRTTKPKTEMLLSDREITSSFERATAQHPYLSGARVTVSVEDQVIHLEGTVATSLAKQALWDLAWGLRRVRDVRDDVVICRT